MSLLLADVTADLASPMTVRGAFTFLREVFAGSAHRFL